MAITTSAKKAIRQNKARRVINLVYINNIKKTLKEFKTLVVAKNMKEAEVLLPKAYQVLDKAAKAGIIKKNNASRRKSRLAKAIGRL